MPLSPYLLRTWLITGVVTFVIVAILRYGLRTRQRTYTVLWLVAVFLATIALAGHLYSIRSVPLPSQRGPSNPNAWFPIGTGREDVRALSFLGLQFLLSSFSTVAPGLLVSCGAFAPRMGHAWKRLAVGAICVSLAILLPERILARNREYMDDFHRLRTQRQQKGAALAVWREKGPPDANWGPTRWGHWVYLGCFPKYADGDIYNVHPESRLESLDIGHRHPGREKFRPQAWPWIEGARSLKEIRIEGVLSDAEIKYLKPLKNLEKLVLVRTPITDAGFAELADIPNLKVLELNEVPITGRALQSLPNFPKLRYLLFYGPRASLGERPSVPGWQPMPSGSGWHR